MLLLEERNEASLAGLTAQAIRNLFFPRNGYPLPTLMSRLPGLSKGHRCVQTGA